MPTDVPLTPLALIFCDQVYREPITGKATLLGIFSNWNAKSFPEVVSEFSIYFEYRVPHRADKLQFRLLSPDSSEPVIQGESPSESDPEGSSNVLSITVENLTVPLAGVYRAEFLLRGRVVASRELPFVLSKDPTDVPDPDHRVAPAGPGG